MASPTTLKDKVTYITITPTPTSPPTSIRTNSFESDRHRHHHLDNEKHIDPPIAAFRQRRARALRRIRNIVLSVISLAVVVGLCSTGWWMRGVYDGYTVADVTPTSVATAEPAPARVLPSPETFPSVVAAATAAFEEMSEGGGVDVVVDGIGDVDVDVDGSLGQGDEVMEWSEPIL